MTSSNDKLILDNMPLVKYIASKYYTAKLGMDYEDLVSYGVMGLIDAINKFDESRGVKFSTYASIRIRSYIIDEIRKNTPISRGYVSKINEYNSAVNKLQNELLREPTKEEIAKELNLLQSDIENIQKNMNLMNTTSLDSIIFEDSNNITILDTIKDDEVNMPLNIIESKEQINILKDSIDKLKERDKEVISLYYYKEMTLKEVGKILNISESRVSQIHSRAIKNLKTLISRQEVIA